MVEEPVVRVTSSNGVTFTRRPGGRSTGPELLRALEEMRGLYTDVARQWNRWEEGRRDIEHDRIMAVFQEWDNSASEKSQEEVDALVQATHDDVDRSIQEDQKRRDELVAHSYDKERDSQRLNLLRTECDAAFFSHVLEAPASKAQGEEAERRLADSQAAADKLRDQLGDPEQAIDRDGELPAERRERNLRWHMEYCRHRQLRDWATKDRRRFNALLKMPMPDVPAMCPECQAPALWHEYDLSLRLFRQPPEPGSRAETVSRLMPGWWERCTACTTYRIHHVWGGQMALPDFTGEQWAALLPPLLRTLFTPAPPKAKRKPRPKPQPVASIPPGPISVVTAQLLEAQAKYPTAVVRQGEGGGLGTVAILRRPRHD